MSAINRRFVLKGMALGSIAGFTKGGSARALAGNPAAPIAAAGQSLLVLVNEGAAGSVFLHGAMVARGPQLQVQRVDRDLDFMLDFERQLRSGPPMRVIGLLDDASAALVVDLARSGGARLQWLGQHAAEAGYTRHHLLNTDIAEGCSRQLGRQLRFCGAGFHITEERMGSLALPRRFGAAPRSGEHAGEWVSGIGYLLASLGTQPAMSAPAPSGSIVLDGRFVSFSIET